MKKFLSVLLLALFLIGAAAIPAAARGGHGHGAKARIPVQQQNLQQIRFEICEEEDCVVFGLHEHDGVYYHCAYYGSGAAVCCHDGVNTGRQSAGLGRGCRR
ncbi:MAG: hypothetical protein FWH10_03590 [Oscillospiraceae bacterium]|nr:hypothetical protein [Oscillospiraceae bacterium]